MTRGTKTAVMAREEIAAAVETTAMAKKWIIIAVRIAAIMMTAAAIKTAAAVTGALKVFRERVIIAAGEKTATVAARIFKKNSAASFNRREKYILINVDAAVFA